MEMRDSQEAFDHAIEVGVLCTTPMAHNYAGDYMYMYSDDGVDFFKHHDTRKYIRVQR